MDVISYALSKKYTDEKNTEWKVKIAGVEKELNNFKSVINQVNVNQEAKQLASGYGIVSLPKNAANGQVSGVMRGETLTNLLGKNGYALKEVGRSDSTPARYALSNLKPSTEYTLYIKLSDWAGDKRPWISIDSGATVISTINNGIMLFTHKFTTPSDFDRSKQMWIYFSVADYDVGARANVSEVMILEGDYTGREVNYINNTKSTIGSARISSADDTGEVKDKAYITAVKDGKIVNLRSLPNGTKDEISLSESKATIRIGAKTNIASDTVINYTDMADGGQFVAYYEDGTQQAGVKGDTLTATATSLTYQLAEPEIIPIQVSGSLTSHPNGTVFIEPIVADAGVYTDKIEVLHDDLPIKAIEKVSKVDFMTGVETELDIEGIVIAENQLSFTHPDLLDGDIVFFEYEYDREGTTPETEIEYYDSRYTIKDSVTDKFYKWEVTVADGVPSIGLVEV